MKKRPFPEKIMYHFGASPCLPLFLKKKFNHRRENDTVKITYFFRKKSLKPAFNVNKYTFGF